ncbi:MAG TPA: PepSY-associated TM helix domain-containing protein [Bryobacteraceae bacterium]|nr:PepSY-associated TM helix domain-containing protein [Bryobacteraceae bacterium]
MTGAEHRWEHVWERWKRRPQNVWLRRAVFQIHLWTGIAVGLYVLAVSVSGSAIVFRNEVYTAAPTGPRTVAIAGPRLNQQQMREAIHRAWPDWSLSYIWEGKRADQSVEVWLDRKGSRKQRLFDPYTGQDMGSATPVSIKVLAWMGDLHVNLLAGPTGRIVNGVGSIILTLLCVTGAVLWWPGIDSWRRNLKIGWRSSWKRINWDLHTAVGFWTFGFVFLWSMTGIYLVFPTPVQVFVHQFLPLERYRPVSFETAPPAVVEPGIEPRSPARFVQVADPPATDATPPPPRRRRAPPRLSTGDKVIQWLYYIHFGNFGGWPVKLIWTLLGFAPVLLFITGVIMWWNRVLSPEARRAKRAGKLRSGAGEIEPALQEL